MKKITLLLSIVSVSLFSQQKVNFETLLNEITDREQLTLHPDGLWTQHQVSSYDRESKDPKKPSWYANHDWSGYYGIETYKGKKMKVVMDVKGAGVITRMWAAGNPQRKQGMVLIIDGQEKPIWKTESVAEIIGQNPDFGNPLSFRSVEKNSLPINKGAKPGYNTYAPIPFAKSVKILYTEPLKKPKSAFKGLFYNINYRLYHGKVAIESYTKNTIEKYRKAKNETDKTLTDFQNTPIAEVKVKSQNSVEKEKISLKTNGKKTIDLKGKKAISSTTLTISAKDMNKAMKEVIIQFSFDGKQTLNMPIGMFYGVGDQHVVVADWYRKVEKNGAMASYWVMPFKKKATVTILNTGSQKVEGTLVVGTQNYKWSKQSMYFYGGYHTKENWAVVKKKGEDFNFETIKAQGVYVGDTYQVFKPQGAWWGEGDEKIYIDQEKFPDHFGTGTEDYYGYAWGHPETYNLTYISQPIGDANKLKGPGVTVNSRVRGLDAIPFQKFLKFDMEQWGWVTRTIDLKWSTFWYQK